MATTVSAINANTYTLQEYSAEGPTNGFGGSAYGGLDKPHIAAYTNVTTASYGSLGFSSTSAATPHVAGTGLTTTISYKTNGIYHYRVKATRAQYIDSQWVSGSNGCVVSISSPDITI